MNAPAIITPDRGVDAYRMSTDAAGTCRDIVVATASNIQGRKFVSVEGWQAIAIAHGCTAGARDVERVEGGVRAIGEIRRMSDGAILSTAEGFVGEDEPTWYGGQNRGRIMPKRADYAIRAMAQTRAISRACRSAFAHVVVMMNAGLSTTPAEEVPAEGFDNGPQPQRQETPRQPQQVIENAPQQRERPAPLQGPIKTRSAVRIACGEFVRELHACDDEDTLEAFLATSKPLLDQVQDEVRYYWEGDNADFLGLEKEIDQRRQLIAMQEAA